MPSFPQTCLAPKSTLPLSAVTIRSAKRIGVDEDFLDMDLIATIADPQWRERVQFLRDFQMKRWFSMRRSSIDQIVWQFGAV